MKIYTKNGDKGATSLIHAKNVSKSDERIRLVGAIDELTSHLGLIKSLAADPAAIRILEEIQETLITVMAGVADPYNSDYKIHGDKTTLLEGEIDRLEALFERPKHFILPGSCRLSAEMDIARTVARRAERELASVSAKFGSDDGTKSYLNRLADYLYVLARYTDAQEEKKAKMPSAVSGFTAEGRSKAADMPAPFAAEENAKVKDAAMPPAEELAVREVMKRLGISGRITLGSAKRLIEKIEAEASRRGKKAVIAVCGPEGNPIAVHVMDGAFLVSFDVAVKKAYTSVAVEMSTKELASLARPGGTFYGLDKMDGGKIVIFGGGVPLKIGETILGGLGVSGGTGEEDHSLAMYGLSVLHEVLD